MVGYHQSGAALPRTGKCICIHGFISLSHAAACISLFSISSSLAEPGPVTGRETGGDEVTTVTAVRDWRIRSITKHDKHFTKTSSKQIVCSLASLSFLVAFCDTKEFSQESQYSHRRSPSEDTVDAVSTPV